MDVSVVISLYNKGSYIKRALDSVLNQTFSCYDIIVVNDGSTDMGPDIVGKYIEKQGGKIKLINQPNSGVSAARNSGIIQAQGKLIALLDADDEWLPNYLETMVDLSYKYPHAGAYGSAVIKVFPDSSRRSLNLFYVPEKEGIIDNYFKVAVLSGKEPLTSSSILVPKFVFKKLGGFKVGMEYGEDIYYWSKIALHYQLAYVNNPLVLIYRYNTFDQTKRCFNDFPLFEYLKENKLQLDEETYYYLKEYVYERYLKIANQYLSQRDNKKKSKKFIEKARKTEAYKKILIITVIRYYVVMLIPDCIYKYLRQLRAMIKVK